MVRKRLVLKICHTEGPYTLEEMVSHTGEPHFHQFKDSHIAVIMVCHTKVVGKQSGIQGVPIFTKEPPYSWENGDPGPYSPGNVGILGPHFRGSPFSHHTGFCDRRDQSSMLVNSWYL